MAGLQPPLELAVGFLGQNALASTINDGLELGFVNAAQLRGFDDDIGDTIAGFHVEETDGVARITEDLQRTHVAHVLLQLEGAGIQRGIIGGHDIGESVRRLDDLGLDELLTDGLRVFALLNGEQHRSLAWTCVILRNARIVLIGGPGGDDAAISEIASR